MDNARLVRALLEHPDIDIEAGKCPYYDETPLMMALQHECFECALALVEKGAAVNDETGDYRQRLCGGFGLFTGVVDTSL